MSDLPSPRDRQYADNAPSEPPQGPEGVWLKYADGTRVGDLPTIYLGVDAEGLHCWQVLSPSDDHPVAAGAAVLPARSALVIPQLRPKDTL